MRLYILLHYAHTSQAHLAKKSMNRTFFSFLCLRLFGFCFALLHIAVTLIIVNFTFFIFQWLINVLLSFLFSFLFCAVVSIRLLRCSTFAFIYCRSLSISLNFYLSLSLYLSSPSLSLSSRQKLRVDEVHKL